VEPLIAVADGAERSRRAAWAKYYAAMKELDRWRDSDTGEAVVYVRCPCCGILTELVLVMGLDGYQKVVEMRHMT
jgi:hypothetical protein